MSTGHIAWNPEFSMLVRYLEDARGAPPAPRDRTKKKPIIQQINSEISICHKNQMTRGQQNNTNNNSQGIMAPPKPSYPAAASTGQLNTAEA